MIEVTEFIPREPTDFWGVVVPAWIGSVGGLLSAAIGGVALVLSLRNRSATRALQSGLNADQADTPTRASGTANFGSEGTLTADAQVYASATVKNPIRWTWQRNGNSYRLTNASTDQSAILTAADDVSDGDRPFTLLNTLPVNVNAGGSIPFVIDKSIVSSPITAIRLRWDDESGESHSTTIYV